MQFTALLRSSVRMIPNEVSDNEVVESVDQKWSQDVSVELKKDFSNNGSLSYNARRNRDGVWFCRKYIGIFHKYILDMIEELMSYGFFWRTFS